MDMVMLFNEGGYVGMLDVEIMGVEGGVGVGEEVGYEYGYGYGEELE